MGEARRETGMGLLKGRLVGQTLDLVLNLVVVSPFLSDACLSAAHATRKKPHLACPFSSGPTCKKALKFEQFWKMKSNKYFSSWYAP